MVERSELPEMPDFEALEAAAAATAARRAEIFELIGQLVYSWSNNESMFIYLIMLLLGTDRASAVLVFGTLNTTRARVDLVQRLAKVKITDREVGRQLKGLITRFEAGTRVRNDFLHAVFTVDASGTITHTNAMRVEERGMRIRYGAPTPVDEKRIEGLRNEIRALNALNRDLWSFVRVLENYFSQKGAGARAGTE